MSNHFGSGKSGRVLWIGLVLAFIGASTVVYGIFVGAHKLLSMAGII